MNKIIELTRGQSTLVSEEDFSLLNQYKWFAKWDVHTNSFYAVRNEGRIVRKTVFMHQAILNIPAGMVGDHKNGNTLDNRRENLRVCSRADNVINSKLRSNNTTGYRGVVRTRHGKWCVKLVKNQKTLFQKNFDDLEVAARMYDEQAKLHFGEFARLNFPQKDIK